MEVPVTFPREILYKLVKSHYLNIKQIILVRENELNCVFLNLKGLGHAILGNFSTDRMVVELTKISK